MKCPKCQLEMRIIQSRNKEEGDKIIVENDYMCVNRACANHNVVVATEKTELE